MGSDPLLDLRRRGDRPTNAIEAAEDIIIEMSSWLGSLPSLLRVNPGFCWLPALRIVVAEPASYALTQLMWNAAYHRRMSVPQLFNSVLSVWYVLLSTGVLIMVTVVEESVVRQDVTKRSFGHSRSSMSASYDFKGKKALVTGASKGIGCAIAAALSQAGAKVVALARDKEKLEELRKNHSNISIVVGDVTSSESSLRALLAPYQPFDILINNAGTGFVEPCHSLTEDAITKQLDVNLKAPIILTKIVTSEMIRNSVRGAVVNISSQASMRPLEHHTVYSNKTDVSHSPEEWLAEVALKEQYSSSSI
ncbi:hypothetical protein RB195_013262 [Necator americanus]|uniref:Oxidoreductase, short chain dehydrogenase/reductase family protein n=1 Tax=Necator americanus TaxID=51031 RepID=A0ABR1DUN7_NECAM